MNNKRLLNYQFLKDLVTSHNIEPDDSELLAETMNACYAFSRINFFDAYVRYDKFNSITLTILLDKKSCNFNQSELIGVSYEVSDSQPTATLCISDIIVNTSTKQTNYKVQGKAEIEYGTHDLFFNLFKNLPAEYWIIDRTEEIITKKFNDFAKWMVDEYSQGIEKWMMNEYSPKIQKWLELAAGRKLDHVIDDGENDENDGPECQSLKLI